MEKISVIIPTVQKNIKVLNKLLNLLARDSAVGEIVLINNAIMQFVPMKQTKNKLKILNQQENLYVNQSWNLGIEKISNNKFLIINDDILCCEKFVSKILRTGILDKPETGLIGLDNRYIKHYEVNTKNIDVPDSCKEGDISFTQMLNHFYTGDWGSCFWGKKENYYIIPDGIKIIYGDNYLLYKNLQNGKKNYSISGLKCNHIHSLSSSSNEFGDVVCEDINNYKQFFD